MNAKLSGYPRGLYGLTVCLLFLAVNALFGGGSMLAAPNGSPLGLEQEWIAGTPFASYLIPGLILFALFGVGGLVCIYALWRRPQFNSLNRIAARTHEHWAWLITLLLGIGIIIWIIVQVVMIQRFHPLQVVIMLLGILILALDAAPTMRRYYQQ